MLKHLALLLAAQEAPIRATPVLLFLREHAAAIEANPNIKLVNIIEASLKDLCPPAHWFEDRLKKGRCLIMFDGLDEVAEPTQRSKVVRWVEHQVEYLGANRFLVSSRPNAYRDNPLSGFTVLQVLPFNLDQVEKFVRNWYFANEVVAHQKNDLGIRKEAENGADDLLGRLHRSSTLQDLAVNPLLLTLIATVHRYKSQLPGRRVELFAEICDVFLGKRQQAKGLELDLTPAQKVRVLRVLAYQMMCLKVREIIIAEASELIAPVLKLVMPNGEPSAFLRMIEDSSALLVQKESGILGFAHLTFQEYLASVHVKEEKLVTQLVQNVDQTWWHETTRLYAAQADASAIVEKCLSQKRPTLEAMLLATDCEKEALELRADLRDRLRKITEEAIEDLDPERRRRAAEYLLERRLRDMVRLSDERYIDRSPVSHAEYQLFIDDMRAKGRYRQPDHWNKYEFPVGQGKMPVIGLRRSDAEDFCIWLSSRKPGLWRYVLPSANDLQTFCNTSEWQGLRFFSNDEWQRTPILPKADILKQLANNQYSYSASTSRALHRKILLILYVLLDCPLVNDHNNQVVLDLALALAHDRDLDLHTKETLRSREFTDGFKLDYGYDRALYLIPTDSLERDLAVAGFFEDEPELLTRVIGPRADIESGPLKRIRTLAEELEHDRTRTREIQLELIRVVQHGLQAGLPLHLAPGHDRSKIDRDFTLDAIDENMFRFRSFYVNRDRFSLETYLLLIAHALNWLCVVQERAQGLLPVEDSLWIMRTRDPLATEMIS